MPDSQSTTPTSPARISRAFVPGAGLGTRLKELTRSLPKPLIPVAGRPLITYAFDHLIASGVERIVVNTHHRAEAYARAFPAPSYRGVPLTLRHEPELLETGGGIKNVEDLLGDGPFVVYNGDILTTLPLEPAIARHFEAGNEATLILRSGGGPLQQVAFDRGSGRVTDIRQRLGRAAGTHLFTGVYIVTPAFLRRLKLEKRSVVATFLEMIAEGAALGAVELNEGDWRDLGTRGQYLAVHRMLRAANPDASWIDPSAEVAPSARLTGATHVGPGAKIGPGAQLHDCILWEGTHIAPQSELSECIVTANQSVCGRHENADF